jgi:hypothetical protein
LDLVYFEQGEKSEKDIATTQALGYRCTFYLGQMSNYCVVVWPNA